MGGIGKAKEAEIEEAGEVAGIGAGSTSCQMPVTIVGALENPQSNAGGTDDRKQSHSFGQPPPVVALFLAKGDDRRPLGCPVVAGGQFALCRPDSPRPPPEQDERDGETRAHRRSTKGRAAPNGAPSGTAAAR